MITIRITVLHPELLVQGYVITSDCPIQVDLIGADQSDNYKLRWYAQVDADDWTHEYISPVAETLGNTGFWFYNPQTTAMTHNRLHWW